MARIPFKYSMMIPFVKCESQPVGFVKNSRGDKISGQQLPIETNIQSIQLLRKREFERGEKKRGATQEGPLLRFKHHGAIFTIGTELVLEKPRFFQADRSRLDAGECEVVSPVASETVASFVKMVEGKPTAITDEDFIPLLVLSDEFGFQELSDACQEFADDRLFRVAADQRNASERCRESGVDGHQAWTRGAEFFRGSAE